MDLMFDDDETSGMVYVHAKCLEDTVGFIPKTISNHDPDQGWNEYKITKHYKINHEVFD